MTSDSTNDILLIEGYLQSGLSDQQRIDFENRLKSDPEFRNTFETHKWILDGFEGMQIERTEAELRNITDMSPPKNTRRKNRLYFILVLSALAVALWLIWKYSGEDNTMTPADIAMQYYQDPVLPVTREMDTLSVTGKAAVAMSNEDWRTAIDLLETIEDPSLLEDKRYLLGHCYYKTGRSIKAATEFRSLLAGAEYQEQSAWYLALAYLQAGQVSEARNTLTEIATTGEHFYSAKATEVLKLLE